MTETVLNLERTTDAPRRARARVRALEAQLGRERTEDATLLISELVTNAVKYGPDEGEIRMIITRDAVRVRFTVHDPGAGPLPEMRPSDSPPHEGGGHGLRLVDKVADRWGVERGSTRVWFEIDL
ncbi:MAG TPA: ATP-binding protein [Solirubrobacteraceae bacterium]|nr:ATP-binding protein [Solirubrobacteraceae bacterium]